MFSLGTRLRRATVVWTAPLWIALTVVYYSVDSGPVPPWRRWAPEQVAEAIGALCALSYAAAFGLAIWAGGQVRRDDVWTLAPARSRPRIAARALAAPIGLAWAIVLIPVAVRLASLRLAPVPVAATAEPVVMAMGIGVCWATGGFVVGQMAPRLLAAPVGVVAAWYLVIGSDSYLHPAWPRHVLGQIDGGLDFGERYRLVTVGVPLLFAAIAAAALAASWLARPMTLRIGVLVLAPIALVACAHVATGWKVGNPLVASASPPRSCHRGTPEVCIAATGGQASRLDEIVRTIDSTYAALRRAGVRPSVPSRIVDNLLVHGRHTHPAGVVRIPLTKEAARYGMRGITLQTLLDAVPFGCAPPHQIDPGRIPAWMRVHDAAMLWAAGQVGVAHQYRSGLRGAYQEAGKTGEHTAKQVIRAVAAANRLSPHEQRTWFARQRRRVCKLAHPKDGH